MTIRLTATFGLMLLTGCYHSRSAYGDLSGTQYIAPTRDEAVEFCLEHEPNCHYDERIEVQR
jgi:hypothetical protein